MLDESITISERDVIEGSDSQPDERFDRFRLIGWWDQQKLAAAKVLVIGAGALGNEIVKNLALLGVGNVLIADKDRIEHSNLSRSVLYRPEDTGRFKAEVAARSARDIYPDINVHYFIGDVVHDLGAGVFRWADVVIGGLDNREARLSINRQCWRANKPWIDGAIEAIDGTARVFDPRNDGPCYECTMSERDWKLLQIRRSCNLLSREEMERGKTPTTPTISSIIAGVQCQEALKIIHGMETIGGRGWLFSGLATDAFQTEYQRKPDCFSHETLPAVVALNTTADAITLDELLHVARKHVGEDAHLELGRDVLEKLVCPRCNREELLYISIGQVRAERALCPACGETNGASRPRRDVITFSTIRADHPASLLKRTLIEAGIPAFDILTARSHQTGHCVGLELSGDAEHVLGPLAGGGLQWT